MWRMLQQDQPLDHVIGTGESSSVSGFVETCFGHVNLDPRDYVNFDSRYLRPTEVADLQASNEESAKALGMTDLVGVGLLSQVMVEEDIKKVKEPNRVDKPIGNLWRQETE
jgi:GDPmannose 4,6-dehydratase